MRLSLGFVLEIVSMAHFENIERNWNKFSHGQFLTAQKNHNEYK